MTERDIELFNDSLERCTSRPEFLDRFYEMFLNSSPEVAEKFKNTNFHKQKRALKASLLLLVYAHEGKPEGLAHLDRMAQVHGERGLSIGPHLYDLWFECLLKTVREFDPYFTAETESAWQTVLSGGIEHMKESTES